MKFIALLLVTLSLITTAHGASKPFNCSVDSFIFTSINASSQTDSYELDIAAKTSKTGKMDLHSTNINAIGYNILDNYIWGYDRNNDKVVKIDADYNVISYEIADLPKYKFHLGDVSPDGILYLSSQWKTTDIIYRVDLKQNPPKKLSNLKLIGSVSA